MKIYLKSSHDLRMYSDKGYWFYSRHGMGPGTIPNDTKVLEWVEGPNWKTWIKLDRFLTTDELKYYDLKEEVPPEEYINSSSDTDEFSGYAADLSNCLSSSVAIDGIEDIYGDSLPFDEWLSKYVYKRPIDSISDDDYTTFYSDYKQWLESNCKNRYNVQIDNSQDIRADYDEKMLTNLRDKWLSDDTDEPNLEADSDDVEIAFDAIITVDNDGDWDWESTDFIAPDYHSNKYPRLHLCHGDEALEHIDELLESKLPYDKGRYQVSGTALLSFDISDIEIDRQYYDEDDYDEDIITDSATVEFNFSESEIESNFIVKKISSKHH